jgi:hypothetical protein
MQYKVYNKRVPRFWKISIVKKLNLMKLNQYLKVIAFGLTQLKYTGMKWLGSVYKRQA